jgi:hypothetical protein
MSPKTSLSAARHTRAGLWALLLFTVLFTVVALVAKVKLETLQEDLIQRAEERIGAAIEVGDVQTEGLTGLRLRMLKLSFAPPSGALLTVSVPETQVDFDLLPLLWGDLHIKRLALQRPEVQIVRPAGTNWPDPEELLVSPREQEGRSLLSSFFLTGSNARIEFNDQVADRRVEVAQVAFDVQGEGRAGHLKLHAAGALDGDSQKPLSIDFDAASPTSFTLEARGGGISADDINALFPPSHRFVAAGVTTPSLRVRTVSRGLFEVEVDAPFEKVIVRGQPEFLAPVSGLVVVKAQYDSAQRTLTLANTRIDSSVVAGRLEGDIDLSEEVPVFHLALTATDMPLQSVLRNMMPPQVTDHGELSVQLQDPQEVTATLTGTTAAPHYQIAAFGAGAAVTFVPAKPTMPSANVELGALRFDWDSETRHAVGSASIVGGNITPPDTALSAGELTGVISLDGTTLSVSPLNASLTGNRFVGAASFDLAQKKGHASLSGVVANVENTMLQKAFHHTQVRGSASVSAEADLALDTCTVAVDLDATQADIAFEWWFRKPPGTGAVAKLNGTWIPRKSFKYTADADIAASKFAAEGNLIYAPNGTRKWRLQDMSATSAHMDIPALGRCLQFPYEISGGRGTAASYHWRRDPGSLRPQDWTADVSFEADEVILLPDGSDVPMRLADVDLQGHITKGDDPTGQLTLHAADAQMPAFKAKWFPPMRSRIEHDAALMAQHPSVERAWSYALRADALQIPPWKGTSFEAEGYGDHQAAGLSRYSAAVDGGVISGDYHAQNAENTYTTSATWSAVPVKYFSEHLKLPDILAGPSTGKVQYSVDRDDPHTLQGDGEVEIIGGVINSDLLFAHLGAGLEEEWDAFPKAMPFTRFTTQFQFQEDQVQTPVLELASEGFDLVGTGHFVRDGDMDYDVRIAISPEMAEKVPAIRDSFNVEGHRIAQQKIELAFEVTGPTFRPRGELAELPPASVTLVSGALQMTNEAIKVIDLPRRLLVDLFKTAGGIMGATK